MLNLNEDYTLPAFVHNLVLEKIGYLPSFPNYTLEEAYQVGVDTLNETLNPGTDPFPVPSYTDVQPFYESISLGSNFSDIIDDLVTQQLIDQVTETELRTLDSIISNTVSFDNFDESINLFLDGVNNNSQLTEDGKVICISGGNIAIASKNYWVNAHNDSTNPWHQFFQDDNNIQSGRSSTQARKRGWFANVLITVGCDIVGGAIGGALGTLLGPGGAVAGATVVGGGASAAAVKFL